MSRLDGGDAYAAARVKVWSENPGKRAAQRVYLAYTPIWAAVTGAVMLTGLADRWGDLPLLALGLGLWVVLLVAGFGLAPKEEREKPLFRRYHTKLSLFVAVLSFTGNYFGTRYFYEVLDMHYGFRATWNWNDVPVFLYPLTCVYFTTYSVLLDMGLRAARSLGLGRVAALRRLLARARRARNGAQRGTRS